MGPRTEGRWSWLPPLNFITVHYAYFIILSLVTSLIFWGSSNPRGSISYADSLYLTISAMTEAGLNTVNLSQMTTWQQVLLFLLIILGSSIWVSAWTVLARKHVFEQRFDDIVRAGRMRSLKRRATLRELRILRGVRPLGIAATEPPPNNTLPSMGARLSEHQGSETEDGDRRPIARRAVSLPDGDQRRGQGNIPPKGNANTSSGVGLSPSDHIDFAETSQPNATTTSIYQRGGILNRKTPRVASEMETDGPRGHHPSWRSILSRGNVGRNAQFHDLSSEERERLGGCEYHALKILSVIVPLYFFLWQFLGAIAIGAWIAHYMPETATSNGANPWFAGIFFAISAFNNSGMALLDANTVPFQQSYFVLITMSLLILAGNTAYPLFLRLILWTLLKILQLVTPKDAFCDDKATLEFILKYPRRVYTNLFPSRPTWWLLLMLALLNGIDWLAFEVLNIGNPTIGQIPPGPRALDGLFQALAVRSGGFYIIPISAAYIGLQVLYVIMMYISVYPVVITIRHSNVYEERSLGIYADDLPSEEELNESLPGSTSNSNSARSTETMQSFLGKALKRSVTFHGVGVQRPPQRPGEESRVSFISQQIRGQLAHDLWWLVVAVLLIVIIETEHFLEDPVAYSVFNVVFEVVSAYGCVGISVGLPTQAYSFSGGWFTGSKLVLCAVMLRGRHRGLPVALDRAVRLPGEHLNNDEEEDYRIQKTMTSRRLSTRG